MNEVHLQGRHPTNQALLPSRTSAQAKCTYREDTLRLKDTENEKPSLDRSEIIAAIHCAAKCIYGHRPTHFCRPTMKTTTNTVTMIISEHRNYGQRKRQRSFDTQQAKTIGGIGGAGNNGDSGWTSTIPDISGEMQCLPAIIDCDATSIFMTPRLLKWLGISRQAALITTLAMSGGVMQLQSTAGRRRSQSTTWTISHR